MPKVPMDYTWAKRLGLVRKPANFISSISDDRGDELRSVVRPVSGELVEDDVRTGRHYWQVPFNLEYNACRNPQLKQIRARMDLFGMWCLHVRMVCLADDIPARFPAAMQECRSVRSFRPTLGWVVCFRCFGSAAAFPTTQPSSSR